MALRPDWAKAPWLGLGLGLANPNPNPKPNPNPIPNPNQGHTRKASALHGLARFGLAIDAYDAAIALEPANETLLSGRRQSSFALAVEAD